jgi:hypothetical protein
MRRRLLPDDGRRSDERVTAMLERHVRDRDGSAAIQTRTDETLRKRLAATAR